MANSGGQSRVEAGPSRFAILSLAALSNPGAIIGILSPTIVKCFISRGLDVPTATRLAAIELGISATMLLLAPWILNRVNRRWLSVFALGLATAGELASLAATMPMLVTIARLAAGAGAGLLYATALASLAATASPDRSIGLSVALNQVLGLVLLGIIPAVAGSLPTIAPFVVMSVVLILHFPFLPAVPPYAAGRHVGAGMAVPWPLVLLGLLSTLFVSASFGAIWPIIGEISVTRGVSPSTISMAFIAAGIAAIAGGTTAAVLASRISRTVLILIGVAGLAPSELLILGRSIVAGMILIMFFFNLAIPFCLGLLAHHDRSGRVPALTGAMIPGGIAVAQLTVSPFADQSFSLNVFAGMGFGALAFLAIVRLLTLLKRRFPVCGAEPSQT